MSSYKLIGDNSRSVAVQAGDYEEAARMRELMRDSCLQMSRCCSVIIGFIIGCFIQCSTLGANFLMTTLYGKDVYQTQGFIGVSLMWCLVTSMMGVSVLLFLRSLVVTAFYATNTSRQDEATLEVKENFMIHVIENIEQFFAVGSLVGVGCAWTVTDLLLDMQSHIYHSLLTIGLALVWCKFAMKHSSDRQSREEEESREDESDSPLLGKEVIIQVV
jgi:hypothetical protein